MKFLWNQISVAYTGYLKWLGLLLGAIAVLNWVVVRLDMDIVGGLAVLVSLYQSTFYTIFSIPEKLLGVTIPNGWKDIVLFYLVFGGVTLRTWQSFFEKFENADDATIGDYEEPLSMVAFRKADSSTANAILSVISFTFWPLAMRPFWRRPIVVQKEERLHLWVPVSDFREVKTANSEDVELDTWDVVDLRVVWLLQVVSVLLAVISLLGLHEFLAAG